jgi:CxxC motif-containing protein (DUF1111 family)
MLWLAGFSLVLWSLGLSAAEHDNCTKVGSHLDDNCAKVGAHLHGIGDEEFETLRVAFDREFTPEEGLGPVFNGRSCGSCHNSGAPGGAGDITAAAERFGHFSADGSIFVDMAAQGGPLLQVNSIGKWKAPDGTQCNVAPEIIPAEATIMTLRLPTPLFGIGLLDAMPDSFFYELQQSEPEAVRGSVNVVSIHLPDIEDPSQDVGTKRVGRLTWKAAIVSPTEFAAAATVQEVGISTQHCVRGTSITAWATDLKPNGVTVLPAACQDGILGTDYVVGSCDGGRTELEPHVEQFYKYMKYLAPVPRAEWAHSKAAQRGERLFKDIGCADCHTNRAFVTPAVPFNGVPGNYGFYPFSDYLLHDVGDLGDDIGQDGETASKVHLMKTAPLWGIRLRPALLHDGRARDIPTAIAEHGGQALAAAQAFSRLSHRAKDDLIRFVSSL